MVDRGSVSWRNGHLRENGCSNCKYVRAGYERIEAQHVPDLPRTEFTKDDDQKSARG